ncbi:MAG: SusC/RagA family TonB-linked outer membrane protein [Phycisphaeraceae bacterium]|nr:SusC/RagA family TonB-linked outer membrane protein [Phycisphaeraceae bacterium]
MKTNLRKLIIRMSRIAIYATTVCMSLTMVFAVETIGQRKMLRDIPVAFNLQQSISLQDLIEEIEDLGQFTFVYSKKDIRGVMLEFNGSIQDMESLLNEISVQAGVSIRRVNETISLKEVKRNLDKPALVEEEPVQQTVSGMVTDENGEPLPGATILEKGTTNGTTTDIEGNFKMNYTQGAMLSISFVGYETQEVSVSGRSVINIQMGVDENQLEEIVVVGYGGKKKSDITGSVASVINEDLVKAPIANVTGTLSGRLPGLISLQPNGQPGADDTQLSIRGFGQALIIVDGVQTDFNNIDPNQIESISILKDASATIYGARAGNGVILVTTKKGTNSKPEFSLNISQTYQGITTMPRPSSSSQYAELTREEWIQSGQAEADAPFTLEDIENYRNSSDPYLYPNTDWYSELFNKWSPQQQYNLSVRGGNERIKYFGFLGYLDQKTVFKNNGGNFKRYNFQSNIDAEISDNLTLSFKIQSNVQDRNFPLESINSGEASVWGWFWSTLPIYPAHLPDPTKVSFANGAGTGGAHIISNRDISGYSDTDSQNNFGTISLKYDFDFIEGLSAKAFTNYSNYNSDNKSLRKTVNQYTYDPGSEVYSLAGTYNAVPELTQSHSKGRTITSQFSLNYERIFGDLHSLSVLALYETIDNKSDYFSAGRKGFITTAVDQLYAGSTEAMSNDGRAYESGRVSYVSRLNYSFANKYLFEAIFRADASDRFPSNSRWGYFPSISSAWRISEEGFMGGISSLDNLKLRASYGVSGSDRDAGSIYRYLSGYSIASNTFILGDGPMVALNSIGLANDQITWETLKIANVGLDFSLFGSKLYGTLDAFYRDRTGILGTRTASIPTSFGAELPIENLNSQNNRGFELLVGTIRKINEFYLDLSGNISWSRAKWNYFDEPEFEDPDQERINKRSGNWTDRQFGYETDGLFTTQDEIDALTYEYPTGNSQLRPGDIRIIDQNNDGIIDWKDQVEIGKGTTPHWMVGFNSNMRFRNFDLSFLFQGAFGHFTRISYTQGRNFPTFVYENRWTEENNSKDALIPRLGGTTIDYFSQFRYKKAGYLRLKNLSFGYNLPKTLLSTIGLSSTRIYVAGTNLLTFDKLKDYNLDPEAPSSEAGRYYPQQRTISLGLNVSF